MTGIEVVRTLRAQAPTREISREQDAEEIRPLGVSGYPVKANLSPQELGDRVTRLLED